MKSDFGSTNPKLKGLFYRKRLKENLEPDPAYSYLGGDPDFWPMRPIAGVEVDPPVLPEDDIDKSDDENERW